MGDAFEWNVAKRPGHRAVPASGTWIVQMEPANTAPLHLYYCPFVAFLHNYTSNFVLVIHFMPEPTRYCMQSELCNIAH